VLLAPLGCSRDACAISCAPSAPARKNHWRLSVSPEESAEKWPRAAICAGMLPQIRRSLFNRSISPPDTSSAGSSKTAYIIPTGRIVTRRPDLGVGPHAARLADEAWARRTMTHDYIRNSRPPRRRGAQPPLFAALNILNGTVIGVHAAPPAPGISALSQPSSATSPPAG